MIKTCVICDKPFESSKGGTITCSDECRVKRQRQKQKENVIKNGKITLKVKNCVICGREFKTYRSREKTCSKQCSKILNLRTNRGYYSKDEKKKVFKVVLK